jgi:hypothetical protein
LGDDDFVRVTQENIAPRGDELPIPTFSIAPRRVRSMIIFAAAPVAMKQSPRTTQAVHTAIDKSQSSLDSILQQYAESLDAKCSLENLTLVPRSIRQRTVRLRDGCLIVSIRRDRLPIKTPRQEREMVTSKRRHQHQAGNQIGLEKVL